MFSAEEKCNATTLERVSFFQDQALTFLGLWAWDWSLPKVFKGRFITNFPFSPSVRAGSDLQCRLIWPGSSAKSLLLVSPDWWDEATFSANILSLTPLTSLFLFNEIESLNIKSLHSILVQIFWVWSGTPKLSSISKIMYGISALWTSIVKWLYIGTIWDKMELRINVAENGNKIWVLSDLLLLLQLWK